MFCLDIEKEKEEYYRIARVHSDAVEIYEEAERKFKSAYNHLKELEERIKTLGFSHNLRCN